MDKSVILEIVLIFFVFALTIFQLLVFTVLKEIASFLRSFIHLWGVNHNEVTWRLKWERQKLEERGTPKRRVTDFVDEPKTTN